MQDVISASGSGGETAQVATSEKSTAEFKGTAPIWDVSKLPVSIMPVSHRCKMSDS